mmetsp:Transcript_19700/g.46057  ORF Transcript_19700/g.46057 Transcript_19700/m.46057 type:complete len:202 (-) Transcript_19700:42-647(-)
MTSTSTQRACAPSPTATNLPSSPPLAEVETMAAPDKQLGTSQVISEDSGTVAAPSYSSATFCVQLVSGVTTYRDPPVFKGAGAENSFLGRTRAEKHETHGELTMLRYEAHPSMALKVLAKLAREAIEQHDLLHVTIVHSVGDVPVGDASVMVQVLSAHRAPSYAATATIMDRLKQLVPIWKQEVWEDGSTWQDGKPVQIHA